MYNRYLCNALDLDHQVGVVFIRETATRRPIPKEWEPSGKHEWLSAIRNFMELAVHGNRSFGPARPCQPEHIEGWDCRLFITGVKQGIWRACWKWLEFDIHSLVLNRLRAFCGFPQLLFLMSIILHWYNNDCSTNYAHLPLDLSTLVPLLEFCPSQH